MRVRPVQVYQCEQRSRRQYLPNDGAQTPDIACKAALASNDLGRHPQERAQGLCRAHRGLCSQELPQAQVRDLASEVLADEDIRGFHVKVADLVRVQHVQPIAYVAQRPSPSARYLAVREVAPLLVPLLQDTRHDGQKISALHQSASGHSHAASNNLAEALSS